MRAAAPPAAVALAAAIVVFATAQTPEPVALARAKVVVAGQTLTEADLHALYSGVYALKVGLIEKKPGDMPAFDPLVYYAGRTSRTPSRPLIWYSHENGLATNEADLAAINLATTAAFVAAELDFGLAGPTLQSLYAKASTEQARLGLAESVAQAFAQASEGARSSANAKAERIRAQIVPGTSRSDAYAVLRSLDLVAYNNAFLPGKSRTEDLGEGSVTQVCDTSDDDAAKWPYRNEPVPSHEGACAALARLATADPDAYVTIWGGFSLVPACGGRTQVTITFGDDDRVKTVVLDGPHDICV